MNMWLAMYDVNGFVIFRALEALSVSGWVATAELRVVKLFGPEGNVPVPITALDEEVFEEKFFFPKKTVNCFILK